MTEEEERLEQAENAEESSPDYEWYVNYKGVWELKTAANLYLGFCPKKGGCLGNFDAFNDLLNKHERGFILTDSETVWSVKQLNNGKSGVEWDDMEDENGESRTSLDIFMRRKIAVGEITLAPSDGLLEGMYFKPLEIIQFFQRSFVNPAPKALLVALGLDGQQKKKAQPISAAALAREYEKYVLHHELNGNMPNWKADQNAMMEALGKKPTDKQIKKIRAELAPKSWTRRGRKKAT